MPYFIDWGASPHPSATAAKGVRRCSACAPNIRMPSGCSGMLRQLGLDLAVSKGARPALVATFDSPKGHVAAIFGSLTSNP